MNTSHGDGHEGGAGRVGLALVVAGIDHACSPASSITTWAEPSTWPAGASQTVTSPSADGLAVGQRLRAAAGALAEAGLP